MRIYLGQKIHYKYAPQGNTSTENNRFIEWGTVVKVRSKKRKKIIYISMDKSVLMYGAETGV